VIKNPILRGFNPDPSIVRVGEDYYVATSTFEWFPGVQIHHSRDLATWRLVARPLSRPSQLDLRGMPDSCGVWAPCLTFHDGLFHLVYTVVSRYGHTSVTGANGLALRDFNNYLVTTPDMGQPWSDPVFLNSSGFDPSLFHDDDHRTYLVNMLWDHRPGKKNFAGIVLQPYCPEERRLTGDRTLIFEGTDLGFTEGPHLFKRNGYYYLMVAEGGTGWDHAVLLARSRRLEGPYEACPRGPLLTSRGRPDLALQRAGHGDLVQTPQGEWLLAYLCGRPLPNARRCVMGRETAIQPVVWTDDGWLQTPNGDALPEPVVEVNGPIASAASAAALRLSHDFDDGVLPEEFQWLRTPYPEQIFSLTARPGYLRLHGRESVGSLFEQALVARRQQAFCFTASARLDYAPRNFQQSAGLILYYNSHKFHYCQVSCDDDQGRHLRVVSVLPGVDSGHSVSRSYPLAEGPLELKADVAYDRLRFAFRNKDGDDWTWLTEVFDMSALSDEAVVPGQASFTGTFVGMACQDLSGGRLPADFDRFTYVEEASPFPDREGD